MGISYFLISLEKPLKISIIYDYEILSLNQDSLRYYNNTEFFHTNNNTVSV